MTKYHTIFIYDRNIDSNCIPQSSDGHYMLCLLKLDFVKIISFRDLENKYFNCINLLIHNYKNLLKFNNFVSDNDKLDLIKNINIFVFRMGSIHQHCVDLKFKYNVISTYSYALNLYFNNYSHNYWIPYMLRYKVNYNKNPINKVLVSGAKSPTKSNISIYPNRDIMIEKSKTNNNLIYFRRPYIPKDAILSNNDPFGKKYIHLLSSYKVCFTDDSIDDRPYILAKFFEIMSSGSLLLTTNKNTKKYFEKLGFFDGIHYLSTSIEDIDSKIEYVLDDKNRELIDKIRESGYKQVYKHHTIENRTQQLDDILNHRIDNFTLLDDGIKNTKYYLPKSIV